MQAACYNQLATTLYTPVARQESSKQHHARTVVCSCCFAAVSYSVVALVSDPAICRAGGRSQLLCDTCKLPQAQQRCCCSSIFVGSRVWSRVSAPTSELPFLFMLILAHYRTAAFRVLRVCVLCVTRGVLSDIFFSCRQSSVLCGRGLLRREHRNKDRH